MLAEYHKIKIQPNTFMFKIQHSSCPPVIFAVTPRKAVISIIVMKQSLFPPCLKGRFLQSCPIVCLLLLKNLAHSGHHEQVSAMGNEHCLCHYSINDVILPLTLHYLKGHVCGIMQTFLLLRAAIHKYPRQPERTAALRNNRRN